jgi:hypothetical protein
MTSVGIVRTITSRVYERDGKEIHERDKGSWEKEEVYNKFQVKFSIGVSINIVFRVVVIVVAR